MVQRAQVVQERPAIGDVAATWAGEFSGAGAAVRLTFRVSRNAWRPCAASRSPGGQSAARYPRRLQCRPSREFRGPRDDQRAFCSVQRCCRGCGSRAANRLGGTPAKLRTASAKRCVRSSAAAASLTMRLLHGCCGIGSKTEVRGRASNLSRPTVSSVGKSGSHGASWLAQRVERHPPFFAE